MSEPSVDELIRAIKAATAEYERKQKPKEFSFSVTVEDQEDATMNLHDFASLLISCFGEDCVDLNPVSVFSGSKHAGTTRITIRSNKAGKCQGIGK